MAIHGKVPKFLDIWILVKSEDPTLSLILFFVLYEHYIYNHMMSLEMGRLVFRVSEKTEHMLG